MMPQRADFTADEESAVVLQERISDVSPPTRSVEVTITRPGVVVVAVNGSADPAIVGDLETTLWPQPTSTARLVVVDLSRVYVLNVPSLQLLTNAHMLTNARGAALRVVVPTPEIREALHAAGLDVLLECYETVQAALRPPF